ncbi:succinylglutamate desuccinylase/aspartoacylase domain-containing protein [Rhizorhabdus histidinilytica]|jgi:predicted deacylase|uniref:succinylglutamate desuccinylase/aspartoacylase domain-containing protein n=1 Tax=Rhizorhabdus histidinilytica TaxID=439228 RepID=UPI0016810743
MADEVREAFRQGDIRAEPGTMVRGMLGGANMPTGERVEIPCIVAHGAHAGPTLVVTAVTHGNEIVGAGAAIQFSRDLDPRALHGTVVIVPIANPPAAAAGAYVSPFDGINMSGPIYWDAPHGASLSHQLGAVIGQVLERADYYVDLHGNFQPCVPMTMMFLESSRDEATRAATIAMGEAVGVTPVDMSAPPAHPAWLGPMDSFPTPTALSRGIPALMVELHGAPTLMDADRGSRCLFNILRSLGMLNDGEAIRPDATRLPGRYGYYGALETKAAGLMWIRHPVGEPFEAGALLLEITDPFGEVLEEIRAPVAGFCWAYFGSHHGSSHIVFSGGTVALMAQRLD